MKLIFRFLQHNAVYVAAADFGGFFCYRIKRMDSILRRCSVPVEIM